MTTNSSKLILPSLWRFPSTIPSYFPHSDASCSLQKAESQSGKVYQFRCVVPKGQERPLIFAFFFFVD
jgi:hypothetical protein